MRNISFIFIIIIIIIIIIINIIIIITIIIIYTWPCICRHVHSLLFAFKPSCGKWFKGAFYGEKSFITHVWACYLSFSGS